MSLVKLMLVVLAVIGLILGVLGVVINFILAAVSERGERSLYAVNTVVAVYFTVLSALFLAAIL